MNNFINKFLKSFAVILVTFLTFGSVSALAQVQIDFGGDLAGRPGDAFSIPVTVDLGSEEIDNFDFEFTFDESLVNIDVEDIEPGPQISGVFGTNDPDPNRIKVGSYGQSEPISGETVLFTVNGTFNQTGASNAGVVVSDIFLGNNLATNPDEPYDINVKVSNLVIELPTIDGTINESTTVTITTDDISGQNVASYDVWFEYDPSVISIDGVNTENTVSSIGTAQLNTGQSGVAKIGWFSGTDIDSDGTNLVNLEVTLLAETAGSPLSFSKVDFFDSNGDLIPIIGLDGEVVTTANIAPSFDAALPDTTVSEGDTLMYTYSATDANGDDVTYEIVEAPEGAELDSASGEFSLALSYETAGEHTISVRATDGVFADTTSATLTVEDVNRAPEFTSVMPDTAIDVDQTLTFEYMATDADGDELTYSIEEGPEGASLEGGTLTFTPTSDQAGEHVIQVGVSDGKVETVVTTTATVTVNEELFELTFTVVMRLADGFDPSSNDVYVSGDLAGWPEPGTNADLQMIQDPEDNMVYQLTYQVPAGDYAYKYFFTPSGGNTWDNGEWDGEPNRMVTVTEDTEVLDLFGLQPGETVDIATARAELVDGDPVRLTGTTTTPDYGFNVANFFFQDETAGLNAVSFVSGTNADGDSPFAARQEVVVEGTMGTYNSQRQIEVDSWEILSENNSLPEAVTITSLDQWGPESDLQGMRVYMENLNLVDPAQWPTEKITDGSGVNVMTTSNIDALEGSEFVIRIDRDESYFDESTAPADSFGIEGVMARFEDTAQLMPFFEEELREPVSNEPGGPTTPSEFALSNNYPNPFNPTTNISYSVPQASEVNMIVFNTLGQQVATLVNEQKAPGSYTVTFEAGNLTSGVYFVRITAGDFTDTKKMLLLK